MTNTALPTASQPLCGQDPRGQLVIGSPHRFTTVGDGMAAICHRIATVIPKSGHPRPRAHHGTR
jgi:hypothetical protein